MLTVFQIIVDDEDSQLLDIASDVDPGVLGRPQDGESVAARPWPLLEVFDPESPRASFFGFHYRFLVMDQRSMSLLRVPLERSGELISLTAEDVGVVFLFNPWRLLDAAAVDWPRTKGRLGVYHQVSFNGALVPRSSIFRVDRIGGLFVSSENGQDEEDFLFLYRKYGLSGLRFKKLWGEESGSAL